MSQSQTPETSKDTLGDRMKRYEEASLLKTNVDPFKPYIVRIDGHKFSTWTKGFKKPFDQILTDTMLATAEDLLVEFGARTAYIQSDEISLVFPSIVGMAEGATHYASGRMLKIATQTASYASARFNFHYKRILDSSSADKYGSFVSIVKDLGPLESKVGTAYFDSRVIEIPDEWEVLNNLIWRQQDAIKNGISAAARYKFGHKAIEKKSSAEKVYMLNQADSGWQMLPLELKQGTFIKKKEFLLEDGAVLRYKTFRFTRELCFTKDNQDMLMAKYYTD